MFFNNQIQQPMMQQQQASNFLHTLYNISQLMGYHPSTLFGYNVGDPNSLQMPTMGSALSAIQGNSGDFMQNLFSKQPSLISTIGKMLL